MAREAEATLIENSDLREMQEEVDGDFQQTQQVRGGWPLGVWGCHD